MTTTIEAGTVFASLYVTNPRGHRYRPHHRVPRRHSLARIAVVAVLGTIWLGFGALGVISTIGPW